MKFSITFILMNEKEHATVSNIVKFQSRRPNTRVMEVHHPDLPHLLSPDSFFEAFRVPFSVFPTWHPTVIILKSI